MSSPVYDVAILGGGPGGYVAAIRAAQLGLAVCLIEKDSKLGGTCLHRGCIPTKTWLHDSQLFHKMQQSEKYGIVLEGSLRMDMARFLKRKNDVVSRMAMGIDGLMKKSRITVITGRGRLTSARSIAVEGLSNSVEAKHIVLATGSRPSQIPGVTVDGKRVFTSDEVLHLDRLPESLTVLGAGAVGMEFASIYSRLGSKVTVVEMLDRPLPFEDEEISAEIAKSYQKQGIKIITSMKMEKCTVGDSGVHLSLVGNQAGAELESEILLLAAGRHPVLEDLGLEALGIGMEGRFVKVDGYMRTSVEGVYAIGDIVPTAQLAHVASAEALVAIEHLAGHETRPLDYGKIPSATYCDPEVASVGLTEKAARERGYAVRVGRFPFAALGKAQVIGETEGLVKIVAEEKYGELLGVHIIGPHATDLIAEACLALNCEATVEELFRTVHAHPTLSESVMEAAHGVFSNPIHYMPPARSQESMSELTRVQLEEIYYFLRLNRAVEERLLSFYQQNKVVGGLYRSLGQEAISVGSAYALEPGDIVAPLIRNVGTYLVKGFQPRDLFTQYMAKATSPTGGRDCNTHFGDVSRGVVAPISMLGAMIPVMVGVGWAARHLGQNKVAMTYIGDGGTSTGDFHEGLNLASVWKAPFVLICEHNQYAYSTPTSRQMAIVDLAERAKAYAIPAEIVDGNDVVAVYDATRRALAHARSGQGPYLLECKTMRMRGHAEHDDARYVPADLLEEWRAKDPIARLEKLLGSTLDEIAAVAARVAALVDADAEFADASPYPDRSRAFGGVFAEDP